MKLERNLEEEVDELRGELAQLQRRNRARDERLRTVVRWTGRVAMVGALLAASAPLVGLALEDFPPVGTGDPLTADLWNDNFGDVVAAITALEEQTRYTRGVPCDPAEDLTGDLGGYVGAKNLCVTACGGDPTAHMCTAAELVRAMQEGNEIPQEGWYSTGIAATNATGSLIRDCEGWESAVAGQSGAVWQAPNDDFPGFRSCDIALRVLCCQDSP